MAKRKPLSRRGQGKRARKPRTPAQYFAQPKRRQETLKKSVKVILEMRTAKVSLRQASLAHDISPATVLRHAKGALRKTSRGTYAARARDSLLRVLVLPAPDGLAEIATMDSRAATRVGEYWNAVDLFLATGDDTELARFRGLSVTDAQGNTIRLLTDRDELERLGSAGVLSFQSLYARAS
jgi:hypothetical protein